MGTLFLFHRQSLGGTRIRYDVDCSALPGSATWFIDPEYPVAGHADRQGGKQYGEDFLDSAWGTSIPGVRANHRVNTGSNFVEPSHFEPKYFPRVCHFRPVSGSSVSEALKIRDISSLRPQRRAWDLCMMAMSIGE